MWGRSPTSGSSSSRTSTGRRTCSRRSPGSCARPVSPLPALRSATVTSAVQEQGRPRPTGIVRRAGLDLVLVALAALAYWQLRRYQGTRGRVDPGAARDRPAARGGARTGPSRGGAARAPDRAGRRGRGGPRRHGRSRARRPARNVAARPPPDPVRARRRPPHARARDRALRLGLREHMASLTGGSGGIRGGRGHPRVPRRAAPGRSRRSTWRALTGRSTASEAALPVVESPLDVSSGSSSATLLAVDASRAGRDRPDPP